jgi:hypothetical protein
VLPKASGSHNQSHDSTDGETYRHLHLQVSFVNLEPVL